MTNQKLFIYGLINSILLNGGLMAIAEAQPLASNDPVNTQKQLDFTSGNFNQDLLVQSTTAETTVEVTGIQLNQTEVY